MIVFTAQTSRCSECQFNVVKKVVVELSSLLKNNKISGLDLSELEGAMKMEGVNIEHQIINNSK